MQITPEDSGEIKVKFWSLPTTSQLKKIKYWSQDESFQGVTFLVLNLSFDIVNGVAGFNLKGDGLPS